MPDTNTSLADEIDLIIGLFRRHVERGFGGRTVGKTLDQSEAKAQILALVESRIPDDKMPAIVMGGQDYSRVEIAHTAYKYALKEVRANLGLNGEKHG